MIAIESLSRHVADLAQARSFYETLGFTAEQDGMPPWVADPAAAKLHDAAGVECRRLTMTMPTAVSDRDFPMHLREYRGVDRRDWAALPVWSVGTGHIGLGVEDPYRTWDEVKAAGELRSQTRGDRPLPMPDEFRAADERHVERPFAAFRDPDGLLVEIQPQRRAHPATPNWVELADERLGFSHVNLNVGSMERTQRFFEQVGVEFPRGPYESFAHPWLGELFDTPEDDEGWTIVYGRLPEAGTGVLMPMEFIEFASFSKDDSYAEARLTDINVTVIGLRVTGIDDVHARLLDAGATTYSAGGVVDLPDGSRAVVVRAPDIHTFLELREVAG